MIIKVSSNFQALDITTILRKIYGIKELIILNLQEFNEISL